MPEYLRNIDSYKLLKENKMYKNVYSYMPKITTASMLLTEDCTLSCTYCYEKDSHRKVYMNKETARKSLDFLFQNAKEDDVDHVHLMLFGGEPTLAPDIIEELFEYGLQKQKETNIKLTSNMITNCTLMNDRLFNLFIKYRDLVEFQVQMSIDGIPKVQNMNRLTKSGGPSFHLIEKTIPKYKEIFKDCPNRLSIHGVLSGDSLPYFYESYLFFREELNMSRIWFIPACDSTWAENHLELYQDGLDKIYKYVLNIIKKTNDITELYNYAPLDRCISDRGNFGKPCGAGLNYATITPYGEIYPCHQMYFQDPEKQTLCGNIYTGVDNDKRRMFLEYDSCDLGCDSICDHYNCYRCIASNWEVFKSPISQIRGIYCDMMKTDQKYQRMLKQELVNMGLLTNDSQSGNNSACKCDVRGNEMKEDSACKCDVRGNETQTTNECNCHNPDGMFSCDVVSYGSEMKQSCSAECSGGCCGKNKQERTLIEEYEEKGTMFKKFINPDGSIDVEKENKETIQQNAQISADQPKENDKQFEINVLKSLELIIKNQRILDEKLNKIGGF